jgi:two-component SAPR family response regulator
MNKDLLSICLFGPHLFRCGGHPCHMGLRGATLDLLLYLVVHAGREVRRECVADQFWRKSSGGRQRSALNSAIWRIGKKLPGYPGISLQVTGSTICLEIDDQISVDTRVLTDLVHEGSDGMNHGLAEKLSLALDASEAPFMDGAEPDWALAEQERVFNIRLRGLTLLMHWYGDCRRYEDALEVGRRLLAADAFRETVQIDMMWLYVLNGQRVHALKHYQAYAELLGRELAIEPMAETRALYDHIHCDMNCSARSPDAAKYLSGDSAAQRRKLDLMFESIEQSRRDLYQTLRTQLGSP